MRCHPCNIVQTCAQQSSVLVDGMFFMPECTSGTDRSSRAHGMHVFSLTTFREDAHPTAFACGSVLRRTGTSAQRPGTHGRCYCRSRRKPATTTPIPGRCRSQAHAPRDQAVRSLFMRHCWCQASCARTHQPQYTSWQAEHANTFVQFSAMRCSVAGAPHTPTGSKFWGATCQGTNAAWVIGPARAR
jgi:hypothetical protein